MANSYKRGKEPTCPKCGVVKIRVVGAESCHPCYLKGLTQKSRENQAQKLGLVVPPDAEPHAPLSSYDEAWRQWCKEIGLSKDRYKGACSRKADGSQTRIAVISDLHVPFHEPEFLADFITREAPKTDLLVINGDLSDAYSLSRFILYEHCPFRDEWAAVQVVMDQLSAAFPKILLVIGNHDGRLEKQLRLRLTGDMCEAVTWMTGGILCPMTMLAKRYPNVEVAHHALKSGHTVDWFTSVGDAWIGHAEVFSAIPSGATRKVEQILSTKADEWNLASFRLIVLGHTHQQEILPWRGSLLVQGGCLAKTQGYQTSPKVGTTTQRRGWLTFTQTQGVTDLNSVRFHNCDWERHHAA